MNGFACRVTLISLIFLVSHTLISDPSADAIVNGVEVSGETSVVTLMPGEINPQGYCTGVFYKDYAVVTAAHCVVAHDGRRGEWRYPLDQWYVAQPGINWRTPQAIDSRVRVLRIWVPENYLNRYNPSLGEVETQIDDIAILFLEKPLNGRPVNGFASSAQVEAFRDGRGTAVHLGYGCLGIPEGSTQIEPNDGKPYRADNIMGTRRKLAHITAVERHLEVEYPNGKSLCPGDSGSPLFLNEPNNQSSYIGVIFAGNGWEDARKASPTKQAVGEITTFYPFASVFDVEYAKFLAELSSLKTLELERRNAAASFMSSAKANGTIAKSPGCHALGISAAIETESIDGSWTTHNESLGWEPADTSCPSTHPVTPWTVITLPDSSPVRWRYSGSGWTTYSTAWKWIRTAVAPTNTTTLPTSPTKKPFHSLSGKRCQKVRTIKKLGNKTFICKKTTKQLVWRIQN